MAANQSALVNWSQYLALRTLSGMLHCFTVQENLHTAAKVGTLFRRLNRTRRLRAEENIAWSFPDWPKQKVREVALRSMQHMFQLFMVEAMISPRLVTPGTWSRYVRLGANIAPVLDELVQGHPMIFITGHSGNWELLGTTMAALGYPLVALFRPLDNPLINRWLLEARGARAKGRHQVGSHSNPSRNVGFRRTCRLHRRPECRRRWTVRALFGRLASSYKSIALLAMHHHVPIICGYAVRLGDEFQYEIDCTDIIRPDDWAGQEDPLFYITARYNRAMETMIRHDPSQYLWLHRRWKSRPKHERQGEPIPPRLVEKLQSLPWMTPGELDSIVKKSNEESASHAQETRTGVDETTTTPEELNDSDPVSA